MSVSALHFASAYDCLCTVNECMLARVPACVCMPSGTKRVCREHAADVFNFKDAGTLCCVRLHADRPSLMNNYLQQCKTNPLIMMCCQATFQHDSPWSWLCSALICVSQSCLWINKAATFFFLYQSPVGCSLVAYSPPTVHVWLENVSAGQMLANIWSFSQGLYVYCCMIKLWNLEKQSNRMHLAVNLCTWGNFTAVRFGKSYQGTIGQEETHLLK